MFVVKYLATKLGNAEYDKFLEKCNSCGESRAEYLRNLVLKDLNGENSVQTEKIKEDEQIPKATVMQIDDKPIPKATKVTITAIKRKPARIYQTQERLG